jgi:hypothetical protein
MEYMLSLFTNLHQDVMSCTLILTDALTYVNKWPLSQLVNRMYPRGPYIPFQHQPLIHPSWPFYTPTLTTRQTTHSLAYC